LKPANVKLKSPWNHNVAGCTVKVLDFGLAKAWTTDGGSSPRSGSRSPDAAAERSAGALELQTHECLIRVLGRPQTFT